MKFASASVFALVLSTGMAHAQDGSYGAGLGLTTFGPALEGNYTLNNGINMRGVLYVPLNIDIGEQEIGDGDTIVGDVNTGAFALLADYYPTGQGWRVSGGLFVAPNDVVSGTISDASAGTTYEGSLSMDKAIAPIITGGYRYDFDNNVYVSGELGAIFSGFTAESDTGDVSELNDELDKLDFLPYIAVTVGMTF